MPLKLNQEELPTINLTSMIDVLFLLIIFFMVGTRFAESETNIQINSPKVDTGAMIQRPSSKIVYLQSDGSIRLDGQVVTFDQLTSILVNAVQNYPDTTVQIKPDRTATFDRITEACRAVQRSGARLDGLTAALSPVGSSRR